MQRRDAKFGIGQVVKHRFYPFRGVIFDVDPIFSNTEEWWRSIPAEVRPAKEQPFYHLYAENADSQYVAYVSEQNLMSDKSGEPVGHPQVKETFERTEDGRYCVRGRSHLSETRPSRRAAGGLTRRRLLSPERAPWRAGAAGGRSCRRCVTPPGPQRYSAAAARASCAALPPSSAIAAATPGAAAPEPWGRSACRRRLCPRSLSGTVNVNSCPETSPPGTRMTTLIVVPFFRASSVLGPISISAEQAFWKHMSYLPSIGSPLSMMTRKPGFSIIPIGSVRSRSLRFSSPANSNRLMLIIGG